MVFHETRNGTLAANLLGVALASIFLVLMEHHGSDVMRHLLLPGFCGGLTTFSAVAFQTVHATSGGLAYLLETIIYSLIVAAACVPLARRIFAVRG